MADRVDTILQLAPWSVVYNEFIQAVVRKMKSLGILTTGQSSLIERG